LLLAGHRGFESVVALYDSTSGSFTEVWSSPDISAGGRYITISGFGANGDCALIGESFTRAPELALIRSGRYQTVKSFDLGYSDQITGIEAVERISWKASDGLEIQGWLLLAQRQTSPSSGHECTRWSCGALAAILARPLKLLILMLINRGTPSSGRIRAEVQVVDKPSCVMSMEIWAARTGQNLLSGLDVLVTRGVADREHLGVTGGSYGGFMTSWLITQDTRFAAAVAVAPHTNQVSEHLLSNIPHFISLFLADKYNNPGGKYF